MCNGIEHPMLIVPTNSSGFPLFESIGCIVLDTHTVSHILVYSHMKSYWEITL